jgi:hypothetical protein
MKLSDALAKVSNNTAEKTAAAVPSTTPTVSTTPSNDIADRLKVALKEATAPEAQKTASQASPVADLTKIASDLSTAEHDALVKEANLYGAAVADGFMARLAQYDAASAKVAAQAPAPATKVASDDSFEKFAAENADLVKEAAQLGYDTTSLQLNKLAQSAYEAGWNQTVMQVHKTASDSFVAGFKFVIDQIEAAR